MISDFFKDKDGKVAIWQTPNIPLSVWLVAAIVARLMPNARIKTTVEFIGTLFLFTWAYMEFHAGASWFRRILGLVVGIAILVPHFK